MNSPSYEIWTPGDKWRPCSQVAALGHLQAAIAANLGRYAKRYPTAPMDAAALWWVRLHRWGGVDLGRMRVRVKKHA